MATLPGPGLPEPQTPILIEADSEEEIPRPQATEEDPQQPWLAVGAASGAAAAASIALVAAVLYSRRWKKAKRGRNASADVPRSDADVELADAEDFETSIEGYSHTSRVESSVDVSVVSGSSGGFSKVLQSHAVEILQQSPDALGLVKLLCYIGSGVSSRVRNSCALPGVPVSLQHSVLQEFLTEMTILDASAGGEVLLA